MRKPIRQNGRNPWYTFCEKADIARTWRKRFRLGSIANADYFIIDLYCLVLRTLGLVSVGKGWPVRWASNSSDTEVS